MQPAWIALYAWGVVGFFVAFFVFARLACHARPKKDNPANKDNDEDTNALARDLSFVAHAQAAREAAVQA